MFSKSFVLLILISLKSFSQYTLPDSLIIENKKYYIKKNINLNYCVDSFSFKINKFTTELPKKLNLPRNYYSVFEIRNKSLYLNKIKIFSSEFAKVNEFNKIITSNNNKLLYRLYDTIIMEYGTELRKCYPNHYKSIYENERVIVVKNGKIISDTILFNIIKDKSKLSRLNTNEMESILANYLINSPISTKIFNSKKSNLTTILQIEFDVNGKVIDVTSLDGKQQVFYNDLKLILLDMPVWELRMKDGKYTNEKFKLYINISHKTKTINTKLIYIPTPANKLKHD